MEQKNWLEHARVQLALLAIVQLLAMSLWFSASAVARELAVAWNLGPVALSMLTISVQLGFVIGALTSSLLNLSDRVSPTRLMALAALVGALVNLLIPLGIGDVFGKTVAGYALVLLLRGLTGVMLAGVYPTGMKLVASWWVEGRGFAIGLLVGSLTIGSASPHLLRAITLNWPHIGSWSTVLVLASLLALIAAAISLLLVRPGPHLRQAPRIEWTYLLRVWSDTAVRRANLGYLGHMFELYAAWTWGPKLLVESYERAKFSPTSAALAGFAFVAAGSIACVAAGLAADRVGRTFTVIVCLATSGCCALVSGFLIDHPVLLTIVMILWGASVVADSAQLSAMVSELCDPARVGSALAVQTASGFLLTVLTIGLVPIVESQVGWGIALAILALGPIVGIVSLVRLRSMSESLKIAGGKQ
ncbi:major facilitator superfamily MFS_1 [Pirellula staleyi DSM 6068]|uniref:Major facilitator superfamily MFS_1 n=1 Tax=Pirellula staleyi (strain ATCC 27377 / DSM 6068 / ICPB 4128) TaxID=530564 RepID=D2R6A2_PIRSD|nr:MFS transporter [Pirellula staleyi]ADB15480.1 major facilitator superfamily MFS_1 [Pirellula staleyi DSM 6068]